MLEREFNPVFLFGFCLPNTTSSVFVPQCLSGTTPVLHWYHVGVETLRLGAQGILHVVRLPYSIG